MLHEDRVIDSLDEESVTIDDNDDKKIHPWRVCPIGKHYVRTHSEHIPPSKIHPEGEIITRHGHCAKNPPHKNSKNRDIPTKDLLSFEELQIIANNHFSDLTGPPKPNALEFERGNEFDSLIRGWVCYWNTVFNAKDPLDPNLVKALIAGESSFRPSITQSTKNGTGTARGLMQLTDDTISRINSHEVELRDHFICLSLDEVMDPTANICAGVRWLFMKYAGARERIANAKLDRRATWDDAVAEYKGILNGIIEVATKGGNKNPDPYDEMGKFRGFYKRLLESANEENHSYVNTDFLDAI